MASVAVGGACAACFPASEWIGYQAVGLIFLMVIAVLSLLLGRGAVFYAALLSSAFWNFFFIPPLYTFHIHRVQDIISLVANLMVGLVGATMITRIRKSQVDLRKSREEMAELNAFLESLNNASSIKDVTRRARESFRQYFKAEIVIYLKEKKGTSLAARVFGDPGPFGSDPFNAALNLFQHPDTGTDRFFPLKDAHGVFGVIGICYPDTMEPDRDKRTLIHAFVAQVASALEREISIDLAKQQEIFFESEKLFQTVLNSVSHELRTPIAIMSSAISNLQDPRTSANLETRQQIIAELDDALKRMNYLVENILDMSRIESGHLKLNLQPCDLYDLAGNVVHAMRQEARDHILVLEAAEGLPMIFGDISLLRQALVNVLHNAIEYTPPGTHITARIQVKENNSIELLVSDNGPGVPQETLGVLFEKFYRVPGSRSGGTGLGLTITRAIVEAHHGTITAENGLGGGLRIIMTFKAQTGDGYEQE